MRKIWPAANVKVYGGGVAEDGFLRVCRTRISQSVTAGLRARENCATT
ncbi:hypothetical protein ABIC21_000471 [Pseudarthrobacter sp. PvP090]